MEEGRKREGLQGNGGGTVKSEGERKRGGREGGREREEKGGRERKRTGGKGGLEVGGQCGDEPTRIQRSLFLLQGALVLLITQIGT